MDYLLSVDVGTGSVRAALVSSSGKVVDIAVHPISTWSTHAQCFEQSSDEIWDSVCKAIKDVTKSVSPDEVKGIGVDATCSLVVLDTNEKPLSVSTTADNTRNVILWMDHRAVQEAEEINSTRHSVLQNVGGVISPEMETPKLLWLKKNMFETCWKKVGLFFDLPDYLTWKLTGDETRSLCSLVCKWTFDAYKREWNEDYFERIGLIDLKENHWRKIGNKISNPGLPVGTGVSNVVAQILGVKPNTPVSSSMIDAHAGALALLSTKAPEVSNKFNSRLGLICGTSTCHMALTDKKLMVPGVWGPYYEVVLPGMHLLESGQSATGKLIEHIVETHSITKYIKDKLKTNELNSVLLYLNSLLEKENCIELTKNFHVWPDFHGNRSPLADPDMKGMISGLTLNAGEQNLGQLYLATIQALAYGTKHILDTMHKAGKDVTTTLLVSGGLSKNPVYNQIHADVTGCPVLCPQESECMLLGCAMLAASAGDVYPSIVEAVQKMASKATIVYPKRDMAEFHEKKYKVFLRMMQAQQDFREIMQ